jgi:shikimate dehydrogenase
MVQITLQNIKNKNVGYKRKRFGLLGRILAIPFRGYFTDKFNNENFEGCTYENFDIQEIDSFTEILKNNTDLKGLSVTIPYKQTVLPFLDKLSKQHLLELLIPLKLQKKGKLKGYNTVTTVSRKNARTFIATPP